MKHITNILLLVSIIICGILFLSIKNESYKTGIALQGENFWITDTATSSIINISSTEQRVMATSTSRRWLNFSSKDCSGFFISLANDKPATNANSIFVASTTHFIISPTSNAYMGAVRVFAQTSCTLLTVGQ